jgi:hypothetical protein
VEGERYLSDESGKDGCQHDQNSAEKYIIINKVINLKLMLVKYKIEN